MLLIAVGLAKALMKDRRLPASSQPTVIQDFPFLDNETPSSKRARAWLRLKSSWSPGRRRLLYVKHPGCVKWLRNRLLKTRMKPMSHLATMNKHILATAPGRSETVVARWLSFPGEIPSEPKASVETPGGDLSTGFSCISREAHLQGPTASSDQVQGTSVLAGDAKGSQRGYRQLRWLQAFGYP